jgi:glutathione S-transferase
VQRAVIVLRAKKVEFDVTCINLHDKPDWFLKVSPHGKVPVLVVDEEPLFESNSIAEFLDEHVAPRLHPDDLIKRARNRAWNENISNFAAGLRHIYFAKTKEAYEEAKANAPAQVQKLEDALAHERGKNGPYFNGPEFSMVDACYAPMLHRFWFVEQWLKCGLMDQFPLVKAWSDTLMNTDAVSGSLSATFEDEFLSNQKRGGHYFSEIYDAAVAAE